jgi:hypothetical protein
LITFHRKFRNLIFANSLVTYPIVSVRGTANPALAGKLSDLEALPEAVHGEEEHEGVEAEEYKDGEVEEDLCALRREETPVDPHVRQDRGQLVTISL